MTSLEDAYHISDLTDAELLFRWYNLSIVTTYAKDNTNLLKIKKFVGLVGRMKMVNPIYKALDKLYTFIIIIDKLPLNGIKKIRHFIIH